MSSFTCISCHVVFSDSDTHRLHYKSDWHRYNLKRKVAELPPVTAEEFKRRVLQQRINETVQDEAAYCKFCRKSFTNQKSYENHLNSKKHKENEKTYVEEDHIPSSPQSNASKTQVEQVMEIDENVFDVDSECEEIDSDEWEEGGDNPIDYNNCLFCNNHSRSFVLNLKHMTMAHTFFVPDVEYCVDIKGLLHYLGEKINEGFMCIWCNDKGKSFHSADAARQHMTDKGHCKMLHEGLALAEYAEFYDYSTSYPDAEKEEVDTNDEVVVPELESTEYQLVLPSGAVVGHRSLMRYYRQSIDPNRQIVVSNNSKKLHKVLAEYKSLGWKATQLEAAARTARDIHYMKRMHSKLQMQLGVNANKFQKHYRPQVNF